MMETLLDVGLNRSSVDGLLRSTGNPRLAWDAWRRLLQSWGEVVQGCRAERFERPLAERLEASGLSSTRELDAATLEAGFGRYAEKNTAVVVEPVKVISWDHRKLGGAY